MNGDAEKSLLTLADLCSDDSEENKRRAEAGGEVGYCLFPDGSECEEWAFYRGQCGPGGTAEAAGLPNPASVHCADQGGKLEIRTEAGGEVGYCIFEDGSECGEWAFFRGELPQGRPSRKPGGASARAHDRPQQILRVCSAQIRTTACSPDFGFVVAASAAFLTIRTR